MRRTLLALPILLILSSYAPAQPPPRVGAYGFGLGGIALGTFSKMHQHGPLYNYGPYYGYPPFEPYGPWNAYLQYNPWYYGDPNVGGGCGPGGCGASGFHMAWLHGGWFRGSHGCPSCGHTGILAGHGGWLQGHTANLLPSKAGCSTCKAVAFNPETTDATTRFAGAANPVEFAGFYSNLPTLTP